MRHERPAIEDRLVLKVLLIAPISAGGGDLIQPVWRSAPTGDDEGGRRAVTAPRGRSMRYEAPAIASHLVVKALAGEVISTGGGDNDQPVWRSAETGGDARED